MNTFKFIIYLQSPKTNLFQHVPAVWNNRISQYLSVIADATPNSSHVEQTTFLVRYLNLKYDRYEVQERFLMSADCSSQSGKRLLN